MHTRANRILSNTSKEVSTIPEVVSTMPQAPKRKKAAEKNNRKKKRVKKNTTTIEPELVSDSEGGARATTLPNAPPTATPSRSSPIQHADTAGRSSPIPDFDLASRSSPIRYMVSDRRETGQRALPPPNAPMSSPVPASIVSVGIRSASNLSRIRSPHASSSVSQQMASSPLRLEVPQTPQTPSSLASGGGGRCGSRSKLAAGDLRVSAVIERTSRLMEKHLLTDQPFPTDPELKLVWPPPRLL